MEDVRSGTITMKEYKYLKSEEYRAKYVKFLAEAQNPDNNRVVVDEGGIISLTAALASMNISGTFSLP